MESCLLPMMNMPSVQKSKGGGGGGSGCMGVVVSAIIMVGIRGVSRRLQ